MQLSCSLIGMWISLCTKRDRDENFWEILVWRGYNPFYRLSILAVYLRKVVLRSVWYWLGLLSWSFCPISVARNRTLYTVRSHSIVASFQPYFISVEASSTTSFIDILLPVGSIIRNRCSGLLKLLIRLGGLVCVCKLVVQCFFKLSLVLMDRLLK